MSEPTIIHNGDHAEFEIDHADTPPQDRPDWPMPSFDARDWADAFCKINPTFDEGTALAWFAGALMRGFDEANARLARKEVMPHPDAVQSPGPDTTPPQASEPGVTDDIADRLDDYSREAFGAPTYQTIFEVAASEIRRLRTRDVEQTARIARPCAKEATMPNDFTLGDRVEKHGGSYTAIGTIVGLVTTRASLRTDDTAKLQVAVDVAAMIAPPKEEAPA